MSDSGDNVPMVSCKFTLWKQRSLRGIGWERIDGKLQICGTLETAFFA